MTAANDKPAYKLLSNGDRKTVRQRLLFHQHFYHGTPKRCLESIRANGLSPTSEAEESRYPEFQRQNLEPAKALRYCIQCKPQGAISAAHTRARIWDRRLGIDVPDPAGIAILRVPEASLLDRCFGLDHSGLSGHAARVAGEILKSNGHFTAEEFIALVVRSGAISCYEIIPPEEIELCTDEHPAEQSIRNGNFRRLLIS